MKKKIVWNAANKLTVIFSLMFFISCLKLCAEGVTNMSTAEAALAREKFVKEAKILVGKPYVYGATGPDSFDCSGLIFYVARESIKVQLPQFTVMFVLFRMKNVKLEIWSFFVPVHQKQ